MIERKVQQKAAEAVAFALNLKEKVEKMLSDNCSGRKGEGRDAYLQPLVYHRQISRWSRGIEEEFEERRQGVGKIRKKLLRKGRNGYVLNMSE